MPASFVARNHPLHRFILRSTCSCVFFSVAARVKLLNEWVRSSILSECGAARAINKRLIKRNLCMRLHAKTESVCLAVAASHSYQRRWTNSPVIRLIGCNVCPIDSHFEQFETTPKPKTMCSTPLAASFFISHMENTNGRHHRYTDSHNLTILNAFCRTRWHLRVIYVASSAVSRFTIQIFCFVSILRNNKSCCNCVGADKKMKDKFIWRARDAGRGNELCLNAQR